MKRSLVGFDWIFHTWQVGFFMLNRGLKLCGDLQYKKVQKQWQQAKQSFVQATAVPRVTSWMKVKYRLLERELRKEGILFW